MTAHLVATGGYGLCAPHFDAEGTLWLASSQTGEILRLVSDGPDKLAIAVASAAGVHPRALAVGPADGTIFLADLGHKSVLAVSPQGQTDFVREYEQQPFLGPTALAFDGRRNLYVCDAGPLGETGLHAPKGSVFMITAEGQLLLPVALDCLAYPSALALAPPAPAPSLPSCRGHAAPAGPPGAPSPAAGAGVQWQQPPADSAAPFVYVAEMAANRVLRFARRPVDVFVGSVFHAFSGGAGPSALAVAADGSVFVGHFDFAAPGAGQQGKISKLSPRGELLEELWVPAPEISGLALKGATLYVTEQSTNSLFAIDL